MLISDWSSDVCSSDLLRAFAGGGYANLRQVNAWTHDFMDRSPWAKKYQETAGRISEALAFMEACGVTPEKVPPITGPSFYTSPEALLLPSEEIGSASCRERVCQDV